MSTYRDDRAVLLERVTALEEELARLLPELDLAEAESDALDEQERSLEQEIGRLTALRSGKTRLDRALETVVYLPIAATFGGVLALCAGLVVVGLPAFLFTSDPGNWLLVVVGLIGVAGAIAAGRHTLQSIWKAG